MLHTRTSLWIIGLVVGLLVAQTASALKYKMRPNDNLNAVARMCYGDQKKVIYLLAANNIAKPEQFDRERTLWVPTAWRYTIKRGEDLAQIAARYLKDPKRSDLLLWLNRIPKPLDIKPGTTLTIPFLLPHKVLPGQTLVDVTRQYYFATKDIAIIRNFNNKRANTLTPGETLDIPIFDPEAFTDKVRERLKHYQDLAAAPSTPPPSPVAAAAGAVAATPRAPRTMADQIKDLRDLVDEGDYEMAQTVVGRLLDQKLTAGEEAQVREVLAICLAAQDRYGDAEQEFVHVLLLVPDYTLDSVAVSPKIQEIFQRARQVH